MHRLYIIALPHYRINMSITRNVNCKINLGLQILRKREDGYHEIHTVFYPTDFFTDILTIDSSDDELEFVCQSTEDIGSSEDNLCVKAFRLLQADFGIKGVKITLEKHIPSGAGLGGGSADAAFTLKMLAEFFSLSAVKDISLCDIIIKVGSEETPRIQECQVLIGHILCGLIEKQLFGNAE